MIVADTDVLIDLLGGKKTAPAQRAQSEMERGNLATTVVTRFELLSGARPTVGENRGAPARTRRVSARGASR